LKEHLPALDTFEEVLQLCSLIHCIVFINALHPKSYMLSPEFDGTSEDGVNALSFSERKLFCIYRGMAIGVMKWLLANFKVFCTPNTATWKDLPPGVVGDGGEVEFDKLWGAWIVSTTTVIYQYKRMALAAEFSGFSAKCTLEALKTQLRASIEFLHPDLLSKFDESIDALDKSPTDPAYIRSGKGRLPDTLDWCLGKLSDFRVERRPTTHAEHESKDTLAFT
jgi:hypothetical protein